MLKWILLLVLILYTCLQVGHFASFLPRPANNGKLVLLESHRPPAHSANQDISLIDSTPTTSAQHNSTNNPESSQQPNANSNSNSNSNTADSAGGSTTPTNGPPPPALDPNADLEDPLVPSTPASGLPPGPVTLAPNSNHNNQKEPDGKATNNKSKPVNFGEPSAPIGHARVELSVLFYSIFVVYVSFIKLIYHNVALIRRNLTEPGVLMIFGIIWELVVRQISEYQESSPRFNSRIFFYLFLPSTVLESASLLSNKWLFLNLLPILVHSILGTLIYASCLGFSIYALNNQNAFSMASSQFIGLSSTGAVFSNLPQQHFSYFQMESSGQQGGQFTMLLNLANETTNHDIYLPTSTRDYQLGLEAAAAASSAAASAAAAAASLELTNLTLADCLVFGTILSSIDSTILLEVFRQVQFNEKLYYLVLGENLMNNAVVIVIFDLLLEFFNETRITVVKIYIAITQFFVTLFGSIFIGLLLAGVALISIRLSKRLQSPRQNHQYQCQAMIETLLILKLAYLTYTLASLAGTSSIVSLATFGILQDQYIKHNLNLRSQLTFKQVILATKTLGFSLVYPLLGMLLVEVANTTSHFFLAWLSSDPNSIINASSEGQGVSISNYSASNQLAGASTSIFAAASIAATKLSHLASQANLHWNFKFLSLVTVMTVTIRFAVVFCLSVFCNLFTSSQLRIKFKEHILLAYGGLKGPLAFALVNRLVEHEEYRDRTLRNKHLFIYTILFITFVSTLIKGSFIRPLVCKIQPTSNQATSNTTTSAATAGSQAPQLSTKPPNSTVVFDEINSKVAECVSHGLNSILGHTKSPYDKFVELNETHIKPWLARGESNTNWLSVFYDNLILDETLNANCFYRSTFGELEPKVDQHARRQARPASNGNGGRPLRALQVRATAARKALNSCSNHYTPAALATIDEHNKLAGNLRERQQLAGREMGPSTSRATIGSFAPADYQRAIVPNSRSPMRRPPSISDSLSRLEPAESSGVLKELVMYNLKVEDARRRRRRDRQAARAPWNRVEPVCATSSCDEEFVAIRRSQRANARMLSTTDIDDDSDIDGLVANEPGARLDAQAGSSSQQVALDNSRDRNLAKVERKLGVAGPELIVGADGQAAKQFEQLQPQFLGTANEGQLKLGINRRAAAGSLTANLSKSSPYAQPQIRAANAGAHNSALIARQATKKPPPPQPPGDRVAKEPSRKVAANNRRRIVDHRRQQPPH